MAVLRKVSKWIGSSLHQNTVGTFLALHHSTIPCSSALVWPTLLPHRSSFPRQADSWHFDKLYRAGQIELELVPQGNLAERIRAAGAGIGGFFTPTGYGTELAQGKETREIDGRMYVLESPIHADFALIKAERGDRWGNLTYRMTARNFGPVMAMAARTTVATVHEVVELGALDPECVVTPGLFVQRVVRIERAPTRGAGF